MKSKQKITLILLSIVCFATIPDLQGEKAIDTYHLNKRLRSQRSLLSSIDQPKKRRPATKKPVMKRPPLQTQINALLPNVADESLEDVRQSLKTLEEKKETLNNDTNQNQQQYQNNEKNNHIYGENSDTSKTDSNDTNNRELIEFYFENAELVQLIKQIEQIFGYTFITDDIIDPLPEGAKSIKGNKISFKTNKPLSKQDAWNLFITFLEIAAFTVIPEPEPNFFRIAPISIAQKSAIRAFIGVDPAQLPDNDEVIRYVYFIQNSTVEALQPIVDSLKSVDAPALGLKEHKAFLITDKAYNIKNLMIIIKELDKVTEPQALSILKLQRADAEEVKKLYESLIKGDQEGIPSRLFPARKPSTAAYFPKGIQIFAEPRTNALILLGPEDAIKKIEEFIIEYVDVELGKPYSPLYVYNLQYAQAETIAEIMKRITEFGKDTAAGKAGGVRAGDKFFKPMTFTPEPDGNRIIIKGDYDDYLKAKEIIEKLDEPQPQVAIEVLLLSINLSATKELGSQIRSKLPCGIDGLVGDNIKYQTSGLRAGGSAQTIVTKPPTGSATPVSPGISRLLGDLISLVSGAGPGNTIISLGRDMCGVWGIFQALETISNAQVIANPFVVATNNTPAKVSVGEVRRVITAIVSGGVTNQQAFGDQRASLTVEVTPQINSDGMIMLDLKVELSNFLPSVDPNNVSIANREVKTQTIVADKEVLALGGLIQNSDDENLSRVPVLGQIPILGWLFKNKRKSTNKNDLLILISPRIIPAATTDYANKYTQERISDYKEVINNMKVPSDSKDPIYKFFFEDSKRDVASSIDKLVIERHIGRDDYVDRVVKENDLDAVADYSEVKKVEKTKQAQASKPSSKRTRRGRSPHRRKNREIDEGIVT